MELGLKDKVALVTGAGQGIGRAIALALAGEGVRLAVNDVKAETASEVADQVRDCGAQAEVFVADVTDFAAVGDMVNRVEQTMGSLNILVNNAGISSQAPIQEMTLTQWHKVIAVNLHGVFYCSKAVFPLMMRQGYGRIISIASVAGKRGTMFGNNLAYCASKAALMGLTVALATEGAPYHITVNAVAPGSVETAMLQTEHSSARQHYFLESIPLKRFASPAEMAQTVTFLASEVAPYITGEIIDVNGGIYLDL